MEDREGNEKLRDLYDGGGEEIGKEREKRKEEKIQDKYRGVGKEEGRRMHPSPLAAPAVFGSVARSGSWFNHLLLSHDQDHGVTKKSE